MKRGYLQGSETIDRSQRQIASGRRPEVNDDNSNLWNPLDTVRERFRTAWNAWLALTCSRRALSLLLVPAHAACRRVCRRLGTNPVIHDSMPH